MQEKFTFKKNNFNHLGICKETGLLFIEYVFKWEKNFNKKYPSYFANYLFCNQKTMNIINRSMDLNQNESCGMDLINDTIDVDANLEMERYSKRRNIYAIGSMIQSNLDEPIFLVCDDKCSDGIVKLKYIADGNDKYEENVTPVEKTVIQI
jgi:hypothetical protein